MELRHLRYFVGVAEAGSFRRAADNLHVAQPALSRQIAALEREIGAALFEPGSRRRVLSAAGEAFLEDVRAILVAVERAGARALGVSRGEQARLRIAFSEIASDSDVVAEMVEAVRRASPGVELTMLAMPSAHQIEALLRGRIDAGFLYALPHMDPRVAFHDLSHDAVMAALPRSHPLARRAAVSLRDLAGAKLLLVSRNVRDDFHDAVRAACRDHGFTPEIEEVASAATVASLVSVGMGVGLMTVTMRARLPEGVVMRPINDLPLTFRLGFAWCPARENPIVARMVAVAPPVPGRPRKPRRRKPAR